MSHSNRALVRRRTGNIQIALREIPEVIVVENEGLDEYFAGRKLYGDDLPLSEIEKWFEEEKDAYFRLRENSSYRGPTAYAYHGLNHRHGFRFLDGLRFGKALGVGSASGEEFEPLADRIGELIILEPSEGFVRSQVGRLPVAYVAPNPNGELPFASGMFDLATCLGVLHHIPNVSRVVGELYRCLSPGGHALVREPIISLGDWRKPRPGMTPRERGIPLRILQQIVLQAGFEIVSMRTCMFQITYNLEWFFRGSIWNSRAILLLDRVLCILFSRNARYHPTARLHFLRPTSAYLVLRKPTSTTGAVT